MNERSFYSEHTLDNGLRVVVEPMPQVRSAAGGFLVRTGARDEVAAQAGVSHFLEHMCFKGTSKRTWREITLDFDKLGSTYNAYTSKEQTVFFGWVRTCDLAKQIELLADMMRSVIPEDAFDTEKKVILEEIAMSDDSIERRVYDLIHEQYYVGHSLSWPVLGTTTTVSGLTREHVHDYLRCRYLPANMVLVIAGAVDPKAVFAMAERVCGDFEPGSPRTDRSVPGGTKTGTGRLKTDRFQRQAVALVYPGPGSTEKDRETGDVLASILGGHNSRFFWNIVQTGLAPHVSAGRLEYCDDGMFLCFGFADPPQAERMLAAIRTEIHKVVNEGVTEEDVQRVKNLARTALAAESEAPYHRFMQMVGDIDALGRPRSVSERLAAIDAVSPDRIRDFIERWRINGEAGIASLGPLDWPDTA